MAYSITIFYICNLLYICTRMIFCKMKGKFLTAVFLVSALCLDAQQLLLLDRFNGNAVVNDSTVIVFSSEAEIHDITQYFTMKNNTDKKLAVFLRKTINSIADSTTDYYCFGIRCWPGDDSTNVADTIPPGGEDYTFASHVTHQRRFDLPQPLLPPGLSSITYTVYDKTTFPEPVEASVTVIYHHSGMGVEEAWTHGGAGAGKLALVYPNPAAEKITIETGEFEPGNFTLLLFNSQGIMVQSSTLILRENDVTFPVNGFSPGLYYGKLVSEKGQAVSFRFQVAR
jgi:hypothetical protein